MPSTIRKLRVFLSHASQDKSSVREIQRRLADEGWIDPWLDEKKLHPGEDWRLAIAEAVETSDIVIICLSNNSVIKEGFVQKELRYAQEIALEKPDGTIFLIPLRLEACDVPRGLKFFQWADYFGEKKEESYNALLDSFSIRHQQIINYEQERALQKAEELARRRSLEIANKKEELARLRVLEKAKEEVFEKTLENAREKARLEAELYAQREIKEKKRKGSLTNSIPTSFLAIVLLLFVGLVGLGQLEIGPFAKVATTTNLPPTSTSFPFTPTTAPVASISPTLATPDIALIECISYNPNSLHSINLGTSGWKLADDSAQVALLDNENDANQALELAKLYTKTCFIGNREGGYRLQYWEGSSGLSSSLTDRDCNYYDPNKVEVVSDNSFWSIIQPIDHPLYSSIVIEVLTSRLDAEAALQIVKQYNQRCYIGRDNNRDNRLDYIVEYWK